MYKVKVFFFSPDFLTLLPIFNLVFPELLYMISTLSYDLLSDPTDLLLYLIPQTFYLVLLISFLVPLIFYLILLISYMILLIFYLIFLFDIHDHLPEHADLLPDPHPHHSNLNNILSST